MAFLIGAIQGHCQDAPEFQETGDGGAASYASAVPDLKAPLIPEKRGADFPVSQRARIAVLGGAVRGFGMLAEYPEGGPRKILVGRATAKSPNEPYEPFAMARVFDPDGNLVAFEEFDGQSGDVAVREITLPEGRSGIWRISFSGGRAGDEVEIRLPATEIWGVRGEASLGVTSTTPRPAYVWIPPVAKRLMVGIETGKPAGITLTSPAGDGSRLSSVADPLKRSGRIVLDPAPADSVCQLDLPQTFNGSLIVEGVPALLCPTPQAAVKLQGGLVKSHGQWTGGPLQARARNWMIRALPEIALDPGFQFPTEPQSETSSPQLLALGFSKSGVLNSLGSLIRIQNQNLKPESPYFGSSFNGSAIPTENWTNGLPTRAEAVFSPSAFASAATFKSSLNPAYGSKQAILRATLAAFSNIACLNGDDLMREGTFFKTRYPITHVFFAYPEGVSGPLALLHRQLPPEELAIWKQAAMAVGDKLADFQGYQSNQWAHMLRGHLDTYLATGEQRFLRYFERQAWAYFRNAFGPASKFGQHPAGYYLEAGGPDGNYDKLNSFNVASCYFDYRNLPGADPKLVQEIKNGIERNLRFKSFFWLLQPDNSIDSPTAINCRTTARIGASGYPGDFMPRSEFPLSLARFLLTPQPEEGPGIAMGFSYLANSDVWAERVIKEGVNLGLDAFEGGNGWLPRIHEAYALPIRCEPATLPAQAESGTWQLPGLLAAKRGGLYAVVFYDIAGAESTLPALAGGAPTAIWTAASGSFISSSTPKKPSVALPTDELDFTFSSLFGSDANGQAFLTGKERAVLSEVEKDKVYEVKGKLSRPFGSATWRYEFEENLFRLSVSVAATARPREVFLNLPLMLHGPTVSLKQSSPNQVEFISETGVTSIEWDNVAGTIRPTHHQDVRRLVIPVPVDGSPLTLNIRYRSGKSVALSKAPPRQIEYRGSVD